MDFCKTRSRTFAESFSSVSLSSLAAAVVWLMPLSLTLASCDESRTIAARGSLSVETSEIDFGEVPVLASRTRTLRLTNTGRGRLSLRNFQIFPEDVSLSIEGAPAGLEAAESAELTLRYRPREKGTLDAALSFETDASGAELVRIPVKAVSTTQGKLSLVSSDLEFSGVCEGSSRMGTLIVQSVGTAPLDVTGISVEQSDSAGGFSLMGSSKLPLTLPPGEEMPFVIRLTSPYGGPASFAAVLTLETTDPEQPTTEISLETSVNRAPEASIDPLPPAAPGSILVLDGTASSDPENAGPLSFSWKAASAPAGSSSDIEDSDAASASFVVDQPGDYEFALTVTDAAGCVSPEVRASVSARTAEGLRFELFWDNLDADLDLHLVPAGKAFFDADDCYFSEGHTAPDWGTAGDAADDPALIRDALNGYGPEIISYPSPAAGTYRVMAHYFSAHHSLTPSASATLRVYRFGVLTAEVSRILDGQGDLWEALSVTWPGGEVTLKEGETEQ